MTRSGVTVRWISHETVRDRHFASLPIRWCGALDTERIVGDSYALAAAVPRIGGQAASSEKWRVIAPQNRLWT
jgi:hypothetical protein